MVVGMRSEMTDPEGGVVLCLADDRAGVAAVFFSFHNIGDFK